jgi:hypothetical protein
VNRDKGTLRLLGVAFLIQAVGSFVSGAILLEPLMVEDNIIITMTNFANNVFQVRAGIVGEMITALGIVMLGSLLYVTLKKQDGRIALIALGLYVMEATILAVSRIATFTLLHISQESVMAAHPVHLVSLGSTLYAFQEFGYSLLMLPFALGATMFYYLFYKSGVIPRNLNYLGLVAAPLALIGTLLHLLGVGLPMFLFVVAFLPNLPFELGVGLWLLIKGGKDAPEPKITAGDSCINGGVSGRIVPFILLHTFIRHSVRPRKT